RPCGAIAFNEARQGPAQQRAILNDFIPERHELVPFFCYAPRARAWIVPPRAMNAILKKAKPMATTPAPSPTPRTGGQILVRQLITHGVQQLFCVPGESYLAVLDALHDADIAVTVC